MKLIKKQRQLELRRAWYDRYIADKWGGWHRPGGTPQQKEGKKLQFNSPYEAISRLKILGFSDFDPEKKLIRVTGNMTLGICKVADYLVNHQKWHFVS